MFVKASWARHVALIHSWNAQTFLNEFLWTPWGSVGKQITYYTWLFWHILCTTSVGGSFLLFRCYGKKLFLRWFKLEVASSYRRPMQFRLLRESHPVKACMAGKRLHTSDPLFQQPHARNEPLVLSNSCVNQSSWMDSSLKWYQHKTATSVSEEETMILVQLLMLMTGLHYIHNAQIPNCLPPPGRNREGLYLLCQRLDDFHCWPILWRWYKCLTILECGKVSHQWKTRNVSKLDWYNIYNNKLIFYKEASNHLVLLFKKVLQKLKFKMYI